MTDRTSTNLNLRPFKMMCQGLIDSLVPGPDLTVRAYLIVGPQRILLISY
jgi:hypothetical protein